MLLKVVVVALVVALVVAVVAVAAFGRSLPPFALPLPFPLLFAAAGILESASPPWTISFVRRTTVRRTWVVVWPRFL